MSNQAVSPSASDDEDSGSTSSDTSTSEHSDTSTVEPSDIQYLEDSLKDVATSYKELCRKRSDIRHGDPKQRVSRLEFERNKILRRKKKVEERIEEKEQEIQELQKRLEQKQQELEELQQTTKNKLEQLERQRQHFDEAITAGTKEAKELDGWTTGAGQEQIRAHHARAFKLLDTYLSVLTKDLLLKRKDKKELKQKMRGIIMSNVYDHNCNVAAALQEVFEEHRSKEA